jgi:hypothetical protein
MKKTVTIILIIFAIFMQSCKVFDKIFKKGKEPVPAEQNDTIPVRSEKNDILNKIIAFYGNDFDVLAKDTTLTLTALQQDRYTLNKAKYQDVALTSKINNLEKYHRAKLPLAQKYNETEINNAILSLKTINNDSKEVENLVVLLENYVYVRNHLYELVKNLNTMRIDRIRSKIENDIYKNDGVNAETYPYLYNICERILNLGREDIDTDMSDLLNKI